MAAPFKIPSGTQRGSLFYWDGSGLQPVAPPSAGQFLYGTSGIWLPHSLVLADVGSVFDATVPTASAVGDAAAAGSAATASHRDHLHGREAFAAPTTEQTVGSSAATGSATTLPRSDHAHGNPTVASITTAVFGAGVAYTPVCTPGGGAFTTVTASGHYLQLGKMLYFSVTITQTAVNTGTGTINFPLPLSLSARDSGCISGYSLSTGKGLACVISGSTILSSYYDGTTCIANGNFLVVSGWLETN